MKGELIMIIYPIHVKHSTEITKEEGKMIFDKVNEQFMKYDILTILKELCEEDDDTATDICYILKGEIMEEILNKEKEVKEIQDGKLDIVIQRYEKNIQIIKSWLTKHPENEIVINRETLLKGSMELHNNSILDSRGYALIRFLTQYVNGIGIYKIIKASKKPKEFSDLATLILLLSFYLVKPKEVPEDIPNLEELLFIAGVHGRDNLKVLALSLEEVITC